MNDTGVIDQFLTVFSGYIDSGFGLVRGDVASLAQILVAIDVTLAALFWAWGPGEELLARLVKKILYVGFFAFLIGDWRNLSQIVFDSFSGLGLKAAGSTLTAADLLRPGKVAATGIDAVRPLLGAAGDLVGFPALFENIVQVVILMAAVLVVLVAFFLLAVQLFVVLIEFKLTTLAGFVLAPFGLFGRTAFLAERVLGAVVATGVKVLVLAVIVGIGSTLFASFVANYAGGQPTIDQALATALGALALLGLGIFGPNIAGGLVSGAPQLGAGAAVGAVVAAGGVAMGGAALARGAVAVGAAAVRGTRTLAAGAASAARRSGGGSPPGPAAPPPAGGPPSSGGSDAGAAAGPPAWAQRLQRRHDLARGADAAAHAIRSGDHAGGAVAVPLSEEKP
jgi:type IV secretion system protein TrbL